MDCAKYNIDKKKLIRLVHKFNRARILVIGDLMLDEFIWGKVNRISPEAPVPVVRVTAQTYVLGGAGNVANNIKTLNGNVDIAGVIGNDEIGQKLLHEFKTRKINSKLVITDTTRPTTLKTRVIAHNQQIVRVDREATESVADDITTQIIEGTKKIIDDIDAIIIEDYGKGVITARLLKEVLALARKHDKYVSVDPKVDHFTLYKKVDIITPNHYEAGAFIGQEITDEQSLLSVGKQLVEALEGANVLITRGEEGMSLFEPTGDITHIPTVAKEVYDVSGAGDTVIGTLTLALSVGGSFKEAAMLSNFAAGVVVGKVGVATVTPEELISAISA
ncbi:MAG: D-glycero-beta-D-manno-heptose-7-phosphate kinase [bacterium]|nr:D-glycero-beta-D-manno-heptose-7-phosphate kinase [bacterium]